MSISCSCGAEGLEPLIFSCTTPKARRSHTCCECSETIVPGERYELFKGRWDDGWETYKTCSVCVRIRDQLCSDGFVFRGLREAIWDRLGVDYVTGDVYEDEDLERWHRSQYKAGAEV